MDLEDIISGKSNGQTVWVCDLRYNDYSNKPIRNIKPQLVLIRSNEHTTKSIYYSKSHLVALNKKGQPLKSKIIPVFDNTGYKSFKGEPLNIFDNELDCIKCYKEQLKTAINGLNQHRKKITSRVDDKINDFEKLLDNL